eukprot:TRINITY_DN17551_c0_g1_i1.p1 TRINITY_DN17551_c0_g1~~TRINITY_DN17551_c0_g1_i1.p1  ORF type:complete len:211 (+),score=28.47 TRINITY_DN17551_c0_g1_i1:76-708(+)
MAVDPSIDNDDATVRLGTIGLQIGEDGLSDEETSASDNDGPIPFGRANADGHLLASRPVARRRPAPVTGVVGTTVEDAEIVAERQRQERMAARVAQFVESVGSQQLEAPMPPHDGPDDQSANRFRRNCEAGGEGYTEDVPLPVFEAMTDSRATADAAYPPCSAPPPVPCYDEADDTRLLAPSENAGRFSLLRLLPPWMQQQRNAELTPQK